MIDSPSSCIHSSGFRRIRIAKSPHVCMPLRICYAHRPQAAPAAICDVEVPRELGSPKWFGTHDRVFVVCIMYKTTGIAFKNMTAWRSVNVM